MAVVGLLLAAPASAKIRMGADQVVVRSTVDANPVGPALATTDTDRAAVAWLVGDRLYVVTADRRRVHRPARILLPVTPRSEFGDIQVAVDVNRRGDVAAAVSRFTGAIGKRDQPDDPCCGDVWVVSRRAGARRFGSPRHVFQDVLQRETSAVRLQFTSNRRVAVWYAGLSRPQGAVPRDRPVIAWDEDVDPADLCKFCVPVFGLSRTSGLAAWWSIKQNLRGQTPSGAYVNELHVRRVFR